MCGHGLASVELLPDGLLMTKVNELRVQSAEWTVLVVIDQPNLDPSLLSTINEVMKQARVATAKELITTMQNRAWLGRLRALKAYMFDHQQSANITPKRRLRRGWLDFVGQIGHTLFGLATDSSVRDCRQLVAHTQRYQKVIVHQVNELTTVLNHTQSAVAFAQEHVNQIGDFITDSLVPKLNRALSKLNYTNTKLYRLEKAFFFERIVTSLEQVTTSYIRAVRRYVRQKASLEVGRLTEDILSPYQLKEVLQQATSTTTYPVEPIQWYYEHTHVYPVWGKDTLIYRVKLPLVDGRTYTRYNIVTWPVPYNVSGYSIRLNVGQTDVGLSTTNGDIFHPVGCTGYQPMVCRTGPLYHSHRWGCPRTVIAGEIRHSKSCPVILNQGMNVTQITEVSYGEYVIVTWGEDLHVRCQGGSGNRHRLVPGTYLVTVPPQCVMMGEGYTLTGLIERVGHVSVKALRVLQPNILNITTIIPPDKAISLLDPPDFKRLDNFVHVNLAPIPDPPSAAFEWSHHGSRLSFGLVLTLVSLGALISICLAWRHKQNIANYVKGVPAMQIDEEELSERSSIDLGKALGPSASSIGDPLSSQKPKETDADHNKLGKSDRPNFFKFTSKQCTGN